MSTLTTPPSSQPPARDIYVDTGILTLGENWQPSEEFRGTKFRWVTNDAVIYAATLHSNLYVLRLTIEPGPGVGLRPFDLQVLGDDGKVIATPKVSGKQDILIELPAGMPAVHRLTLHVDGGGKTALNDSRILNFRVFEASLERRAPDVFPAWAKTGKGWYALENFAGITFRWVDNDAIVDVAATGGKKLQFDAEPGPGLDSRPFKLFATEIDGPQLASWDVGTRRSLELTLPKVPISFKLHVSGGGKSAPGDNRKMNFRVFPKAGS